jgi:hypothetical protein
MRTRASHRWSWKRACLLLDTERWLKCALGTAERESAWLGSPRESQGCVRFTRVGTNNCFVGSCTHLRRFTVPPNDAMISVQCRLIMAAGRYYCSEVLPLAACSDEICQEGGCTAMECLYRTFRWHWVERNDNPFPVSATSEYRTALLYDGQPLYVTDARRTLLPGENSTDEVVLVQEGPSCVPLAPFSHHHGRVCVKPNRTESAVERLVGERATAWSQRRFDM